MPDQAYADLAGRGVIVTGGGSGIGAALAAGFAAAGAKVTLFDIDRAAVEAVAARLTATSRHPVASRVLDLTDTPALEAAVAEAAAAMGGLGVLVNNAARDDRIDLATMTEAAWDRSLAVNLRHYAFAAKAAAPHLAADGAGAIVNFGSIAFLLNMGELPAYAAAKAGIIGLTKSLAGLLGPQGVRVNAILPGMVVTARQKALWLSEESIAAMVDRQCLKRSLVADDMVGPCLFLASKAAGAITAQTLIADGGCL